jgi:SAM-dependent methyltransferase
MTVMQYYRGFYEQEGIRSEDVASEERISMALNIIPKGIYSVLDVGCGDGTLLKMLDANYVKAGIDISYNVLKQVEENIKAQALSSAIPISGSSFDLVLCTEVIEHLDQGEFESTRAELQRIAKKFILVTVPYHEDLAGKETRCPNCSYVYHIHLHLRNFDIDDLLNLFSEFELTTCKYSTVREKSFPKWLLNVRRKIGRRYEWDESLLCPKCGHKNQDRPKRTMISIITGILAECCGKKSPKWIACLYEKI